MFDYLDVYDKISFEYVARYYMIISNPSLAMSVICLKQQGTFLQLIYDGRLFTVWGGYKVDTNNVYISFSGLGLKFEKLGRVAFTVFGVEIFWYGIIITAAIIAAVFMALRSCRKYDLTEDHVLDLVLFSTPVAVVLSGSLCGSTGSIQ